MPRPPFKSSVFQHRAAARAGRVRRRNLPAAARADQRLQAAPQRQPAIGTLERRRRKLRRAGGAARIAALRIEPALGGLVGQLQRGSLGELRQRLPGPLPLLLADQQVEAAVGDQRDRVFPGDVDAKGDGPAGELLREGLQILDLLTEIERAVIAGRRLGGSRRGGLLLAELQGFAALGAGQDLGAIVGVAVRAVADGGHEGSWVALILLLRRAPVDREISGAASGPIDAAHAPRLSLPL